MQGPANPSANVRPTSNTCNFCDEPGHFIRECQDLHENFIQKGLAILDPVSQRVTLPNGRQPPQSFTGTMKERYLAYHDKYPTEKVSDYNAKRNANLAVNIIDYVDSQPDSSPPFDIYATTVQGDEQFIDSHIKELQSQIYQLEKTRSGRDRIAPRPVPRRRRGDGDPTPSTEETEPLPKTILKRPALDPAADPSIEEVPHADISDEGKKEEPARMENRVPIETDALISSGIR
ncbi:hypothetical protein CALVIDRAFT_568655, partial [Calocera viscosa TUFC12733]